MIALLGKPATDFLNRKKHTVVAFKLNPIQQAVSLKGYFFPQIRFVSQCEFFLFLCINVKFEAALCSMNLPVIA